MSEKNIYTKLAEARVRLQEKELKKSGKNKFAGFEYFELKDFLPSINSIFKELGLISIFNLDEKKAKLQIVNSEKLDEVLTFYTPTAEADIKGAQAIQKLGGVHTYLKRYLYINALEIAENDTVDALPNQETKTTPKQAPKKDEKIEEKGNEKLKVFIKKNDLDINLIAKHFGLSHESKQEDYLNVFNELSEMDKNQMIDFVKLEG